MTQKEMILQYIDDFGSITPMDAFADLGITRLASRIHEIRQYQPIAGEMITSRNRYGKTVHFMRYTRAVK